MQHTTPMATAAPPPPPGGLAWLPDELAGRVLEHLTGVQDLLAAAGTSRFLRAAVRAHPIGPLLLGLGGAGGGGAAGGRPALPGAVLLAAVRAGALPAVRWLLAHHAADAHPATLAVACRHGCPDAVQALLAAGAAADGPLDLEGSLLLDGHEDHVGSTPLLVACEAGHLPCARLLAAQGADVDRVDRHGWSCLMRAAWAGHSELVRRLIRWGADVHYFDGGDLGDGWDALMLAAERGDDRSVEALLAAGADPDAVAYDDDKPGDDPVTVLMIAARRGHPRCVELLLRGGADVRTAVRSQDAREDTARQMAARNGHAECARLLALDGG